MNVKNRSTCNIDYRLIYDFTTIIWQGLYDLMQKCENFGSLRSLVVTYEVSQVSTNLIKASYIMNVTNRRT